MNISRKSFVLFLVLLITLIVGISMSSATNSSDSILSDNSSHTNSKIYSLDNNTDITHKESNTNINKTISKENKSIKSDRIITNFEDLQSNIKNNGTYVIGNDFEVNSQLTTNDNVNVTINGNGHTLLFSVNGHIQVSKNSILNIENIIFNGNNNNRTTAGITNSGNLTITNTTIKNFNNPEKWGGAIYNTDNNHNLTITNSTFKGNYAKYGGAIFNDYGTYSVYTDNIFIENKATKASAVWVDEYSIFTNNTFINNNATENGGAILITGNSTYINNTFINNTANKGGAIYNNIAKSTFTYNTFRNNTAVYGGAIYNDAVNSTYTNNNFINNSASFDGGAIYLEDFSTNHYSNIYDNIFNYNIAKRGGAIYTKSNLNCIHNNFTSNLAQSFGGAIHNELASLTCINNTFTDNKSNFDGGAIRTDNGTLLCNENEFTENYAKNSGGAIYIQNSNLTLIDNVFMSNRALSSGGAIEEEVCNANLTNNIFVDNKASCGGVIEVYQGNLTCIKNVFSKNTAALDGGVIYSYKYDFINTYKNNIICINNTFMRNEALRSGGSILALNSTLTCNDNNFINNTALSYGGAIGTKNNINTFNNNIFTENTALLNGGAIYNNQGKTIITNSTFTNNSGNETLYLTGNNTLNNNKYINTSIEFSNRNIVSTKSAYTNENISISTSFKLQNPSFYDENILNNINYTIQLKGINHNTILTQENPSFNSKVQSDTYKVYGLVSISKYTSNTITITVNNLKANTTINTYNITYPEKVVNINGQTSNITSGNLNVSLYKNKSLITSNNVIINHSKWNISFDNLSSGEYNITVSYHNDTNNYDDFINTSNFKVEKQKTNTTIQINTTNPQKLIIRGTTCNLTNGTLKIEICNDNKKITTVKINNSTWQTIITDINAGGYTITVIFEGDLEHEAFTNRTSIKIDKQVTNTTINITNVGYPENIIVSGETRNISDAIINVSIGSKTRGVCVTGGIWNTTFTNITPGTYNISIKYAGDINHEAFTNTTHINVNKMTSILRVDNIITKLYKQTQLVAHITNINNENINGGNVVFKINGKTLSGINNITKINVVNGTATLTYIPTLIKNLTLTVVYSGNNIYSNNSNNTLMIVTPRDLNINILNIDSSKGGKNITLTAVVSESNNFLVQNGTVIFKINGKTLKDDKGNTIKAQIINGIASIKYTLPDGMSAKDYIITAVASVKNANRTENSTILTIEKRSIDVTLNKITSTKNNITITGTIKDHIGHYTNCMSKIGIKINGKTLKENGKIVKFNIQNGIINITIPSKYTTNLKEGLYNITVVVEESAAYKSQRNMTTLKVISSNS